MIGGGGCKTREGKRDVRGCASQLVAIDIGIGRRAIADATARDGRSLSGCREHGVAILLSSMISVVPTSCGSSYKGDSDECI